jgi:hypothetical protein
MPDSLFVDCGGMQLDARLLPFQFGAGAEAHDQRQSESEDWCFHFFE